MTILTNRALRRDLETIFAAGTLAGLSDGQLLGRFADRGDEAEAAFAILIERHGPMVWRVCRGVLRDPHDAEDAFQATFLVLFRRAGSIRKTESVGPWLHGVANRVASCARSAAARRRAHERRCSEARRDDPSAPDPDLAAVIHAELARLPERYRTPIVLCDLEEHSLDEAARRLGWPLGTIKSRLNRGRRQLRDRLARRGVAPAIAGLAGVPVTPAPTGIIARIIAGEGGASVEVLALARAVGRITIMTRMKLAAVVAIAMGLSAAGIGALAGGPRRGGGIGATAQVAAPSPKAVAATPAKKKARPRLGDDSRRVMIAVSGRATDPAGKPVAGATIYVIDTNLRRMGNADDILATATTGRDGRYVARDVALPVWKPEVGMVPPDEEGRFQVAGTAAGFGFTWHPATHLRAPDAHPDEPIINDLAFGPPVSLHGKVVAEHGRPLADARVQVGVVDDLRGRMWTCRRVDPTGSIPEERLAFDGIVALPRAMLSARTGPDGTYRIDGLPREARFISLIDPGPEYDFNEEAIATTAGPLKDARALGHDAVLNASFLTPSEAMVKVILADTKQPVRGATVRALLNDGREYLRAGGVGVTGADGSTTLHLRPGRGYDLAIEPPLGLAYYLPDRVIIPVSGGGNLYSPFELEPAAIVVMEARDARTGAGVEGVRFEFEADPDGRRRDLHSQLVIADHPVTDERGRLRAIIVPGQKRFFAVELPRRWELDGPPGQPTILVAGQERTIRWSLVQVPDPAQVSATPAEPPVPFPAEMIETWRTQDRLARSGKFRVRRHHVVSLDATGEPIPTADELEAFLDATDLSKADHPAAAIEARFPSLRAGPTSSCEVIEDGHRLRNTCVYPFNGAMTEVRIANGREVVSYTGASAYAVIFSPTGGPTAEVFGWRAYCARPWVLTRGRGRNRAIGEVRREEAGDRLIVEETTDRYTARWVVDRRTGFVHADSQRSRGPNVVGQILRQYGPKAEPNGVIRPTVHVLVRLLGERMPRIDLDVIEAVDFAYRPTPSDFAVAAPAATLIVDHRGDAAHPKQRMCRYPVPDVIAFADATPAIRRPIDPVRKPGPPAPPNRP